MSVLQEADNTIFLIYTQSIKLNYQKNAILQRKMNVQISLLGQ